MKPQVSQDQATFITFETRFKPPKGRDVRVFVVGTIPEMGHCKIDDPRLTMRLEKSIKRAYKEKLAGEVRRHLDGPPTEKRDFGYGDDESESESDTEGVPDINTKDLRELLEGQQGPKYAKVEVKPILAECLTDFAIPLDEDPDDTGEANLWASDAIRIGSVKPGEKFSYLYFVWDLDSNRLWDIERFQEARNLTIPKPQIDPKRGNAWVCRSQQLHMKGTLFKPKSHFDPSSDESDDFIADDDDDDSDDDL